MWHPKLFYADKLSDGQPVLSCGDEGMETDLVFAASYEPSDSKTTKQQQSIINYIVNAVQTYNLCSLQSAEYALLISERIDTIINNHSTPCMCGYGETCQRCNPLSELNTTLAELAQLSAILKGQPITDKPPTDYTASFRITLGTLQNNGATP